MIQNMHTHIIKLKDGRIGLGHKYTQRKWVVDGYGMFLMDVTQKDMEFKLDLSKLTLDTVRKISTMQ
jgi:hypothetical protein